MEKIDLKKQFKELYGASAKKVAIIEVPELNYLMVDGTGDPNTSVAFQQSVEALFSTAYTAKFILKKGPAGTDYAVMPLEGLWWMDDMSRFCTSSKDEWQWTVMIMQPDFVPRDVLLEAADAAGKKKELPALGNLRIERFHEGTCVQVLHIGPYADEGPAVENMHAFAQEQGYRLAGKHHEIYLGDPRRVAPEKLKTILRQPVKPA